jgi:hypothetical protein
MAMPKKPPLNASRFTDMFGERLYKRGLRRGRDQERNERIGWFNKKARNSKRAQGLAIKLSNCRPKHRCNSAACPECASAGQELLAKMAARFIKKNAGTGTVVFVTVTPADGLIKPGQLSVLGHERAVRRWRDRLGNSGVTWFVGATDLSFNEDKNGTYQYWSLHFHGLAVTMNIKKLKKRLKAQFPNKTKIILRAVKVEKWDGRKKALRYLLKPDFVRRVSTKGSRYDKETGTTRKCQTTSKQRLTSGQKKELLKLLDQVGIQGRLLMKKCQPINRITTGPELRLSK